MTPTQHLAAAYAEYGSVDPVATKVLVTADSATDKWIGANLVPSGTVVGVPNQSPDVLMVDDEVPYRDDFGATLDTEVKNFHGGVYHPDTGLVYFLPGSSEEGIGVFDPVAGTLVFSMMGLPSLTGSWRGGVVASNRRIYCAPNTSQYVLVIDPRNKSGSPYGTASQVTLGATLTGSTKWAGIARADNGVMYCAANDSPDVLRIDPHDLTASDLGTATRTNFGLDLSDGTKWQGIILGADGLLYCVPFFAPDILIIDPVANTAVRSALGATFSSGGSKWEYGCNGPNGRIYCMPRTKAEILEIDPIGQTARLSKFGATISAGGSKWESAVQTLPGTIIGVPHDDDNLLVLTFPGVPALPTHIVLSVQLNKL
jgi:hypothetical protein